MKRRLGFMWVVIGILAVLALLVTASGCTNTATTASVTSKTSAVTTSSAPPVVTTSSAVVPPPVSSSAPPAAVVPPPISSAQPPPSPKPPAPAASQTPPVVSVPPPPASSNPPPAAGGSPPVPPEGAAPPPPAGAGAAPPESLPGSGKMVLTSTAVTNGVIADINSCNGVTAGTTDAAKSPALAWTGAPAATKSFAVILNGVKGGGDEGIMLVVYNIPSTATGLSEGLKDDLADPKIGTLGVSDTGNTNYRAPCGGTAGPWKKTVTLYALSSPPAVPSDPKSVDVVALRTAMEKITLDTAILDFNVIIK